MDGILKGIRVIEFAALGGGPLAGLLLGDFGADVIKIENPAGGDPSRIMYYLNERKIPPENHSILFEFSNRHKRGITLNLAHEKGREIAHRLIEKSDVFTSNYFPKTLKKLELDYETLSKINPRLIYATSPAFGKRGPDSNKQAYDTMAMARSGMLMAISTTDEPGSMIPGAVADMMGGTFLGFAAIMGILARERYGVGQEIDSSLFGPMLWAQYLNISGYYSGNRLMPKEGRSNTWKPTSNSYKCKDGKWLYLIARDWAELCRVLHLERLENDPRFADDMARTKNRKELIKVLEEAFAGKTRDEWIEHIKSSNAPSTLYENVNVIPDLVHDEQILANDLLLEENHRGLGPIKMLKFPFNFSKTPVATSRKEAPCLGEHTDEVLAEYGYSAEEIAQFRKDRVI